MLLQSLIASFSPTLVLIIGAMTVTIWTIATTALMSCYQTLVYMDGRCRADNYDLQLLAEEIGMTEEMVQALSNNGTTVTQAGYPDYAAPAAIADAGSPAPAMSFPDYSAPPPAEGKPPGGQDVA
jgi:protein-disulfide isomerase-like protein with CxxC motif